MNYHKMSLVKKSTTVNGYGILGEEYEGNNDLLFFGPAYDTTYDGGVNDGGFTWVSPKYKDTQGQMLVEVQN